MNKATLKSQITELLTTIEDERFLRSVTAMLQTFISGTSSILNQEEKAAVDEGIQDLQAGKLISHQQVKQNTQARYPHLQSKAWK